MSKAKTSTKTPTDVSATPFREVDAKTAKQIIATSKFVLLDFSAEWCGPCHKLKERLTVDLVPKLPPGTEVISVDVDNEGKYADEMGIRAMPTLFLYKDGKQLKVLLDGVEQDCICGFKPTIIEAILAAFV